MTIPVPVFWYTVGFLSFPLMIYLIGHVVLWREKRKGVNHSDRD